MRIALVCPYAWDAPGGVRTHVRELAEHLRGGGDEVLVLAPGRSAASEPWVRIVGRPLDVSYNASTAPIDPRPWSRSLVREQLRAFGPDVVHVHEPLTPSTSMWATLEARAPVVATFHSAPRRSRLFRLASPLLRRIDARISERIAVSEAAADFARAGLGGRFEVIPNGTDVARFSGAVPASLAPGPKLLFVGRLEERKGFPVALAAFEILAHERVGLRLVVVGDGGARTAADRLAPDLRGRVDLAGAVSDRDLPGFHAACDVYLGPAGGGESFGMVLVEAMAAGLPVVVSDIAGYREVVRDGLEGFLVPAGEPAAFAQAAGRLLDDPELSARVASAGRERAAGFDWGVVAARIERVYARAIEGGPPRLR